MKNNKELTDLISEGISNELAEQILALEPLKVNFDKTEFLTNMKTLVVKGLSVDDAWMVTGLKSLADHAATYTDWGASEVEGDNDFHREVNGAIDYCTSGLINAFGDIYYLFEEEAVGVGGAN